ncbi:MAG TPA: alpha/beta hydrolase [Candidatus Bathyarchaeia archaeon]|nr:alpha/beta hydrolase [Candidatus Bathyarchaeia archaeon]
MDKDTQLGFIHRFLPPNKVSGSRTREHVRGKEVFTTLLLLHGTGGSEEDMLPLGQQIAPEAAILSPRGKVLENGMPRFFRRLSEGVFDIEDLKFRTYELADFVEQASRFYGFNLQHVIAVGYSNGANIAASELLLRPEIFSAAILFRAMVPLEPERLPDLTNKYIFMSSGLYDPIVPKKQAETLFGLFKKAGAKVSLNWQDSGHELTMKEVQKAEKWMHSDSVNL